MWCGASPAAHHWRVAPMDNPVKGLERECADAALAQGGDPVRCQTGRQIEIRRGVDHGPASASSCQGQQPANCRPASPALDVRAHRSVRRWTAGRQMRRVWGLNRSGRRRWLRRWRIVWTDNRETAEGICGQGQGQQEFHCGFHEVTPSSSSGLVYGGFTVRCTVGASPPTALRNNLGSHNQTSEILVSILGPRRYYKASYQLNQTRFLRSPSAIQGATIDSGKILTAGAVQHRHGPLVDAGICIAPRGQARFTPWRALHAPTRTALLPASPDARSPRTPT